MYTDWMDWIIDNYFLASYTNGIEYMESGGLEMANITIDLNQAVKKMKPMHGGGQPPMGGKDLTEYFHYMTEAGIPFSRLHDVGGVFGGGRFVDIPNIFRDFDADENDPDSYDFAFTDYLLKALVEAGVEPYYRLGITIENQAYIRAYHTYPPRDPQKWARICEHIIRHYTQGWAPHAKRMENNTVMLIEC